MKTTELAALGILGGLVALTTGCVEHRTVYVPAYQSGTVYQMQPGYAYPSQSTYQSQPLVTASPGPATPYATRPAAPPDAPAVTVSPAVQAAPPPTQIIVSQTPPAPIIEVQPAPPGPAYIWAPGYWSWNGRWVWVRGGWVVRPRPQAVWVAPHWTRHGRGYVWVHGRWR